MCSIICGMYNWTLAATVVRLIIKRPLLGSRSFYMYIYLINNVSRNNAEALLVGQAIQRTSGWLLISRKTQFLSKHACAGINQSHKPTVYQVIHFYFYSDGLKQRGIDWFLFILIGVSVSTFYISLDCKLTIDECIWQLVEDKIC